MKLQEGNDVKGFESAPVVAAEKMPKWQALKDRLSAARKNRQKGELSLIEAGAVLGAAALLALAVYVAVPYIRNMIQANSFKSEASMFHTGIQNATETDADFSGESLTSLAQNHAFDAAGSRVSADHTTLTGMFGGNVTVSVGAVTNPNDAVVVSYTVPSAVCAMTVGALSKVFAQVDVGTSTVFSPTVAFSSQTAGSACQVAGSSTATVKMYTTRS